MPLLHVSALRQFARTATGNQLSGDEITRLAVAGAVNDDELRGKHGRDSLKRMLAIWRDKAAEPGDGGELFTDRALWRSLPAPPSDDRLVLLLVDLLGLSVDDAAVVVGMPAADAAVMLEKERDNLHQSDNPTALIIEDEAIIRHDLSQILQSIGISVAGWAASIDDAVALCRSAQPDLVITDYDLGSEKFDGAAVRRIRREVDAPVIFVTGHPDDVLKGEDFEPDVVVSKPYRPQAIAAAAGHSLSSRDRIESL